jgi:hypothetical protein
MGMFMNPYQTKTNMVACVYAGMHPRNCARTRQSKNIRRRMCTCMSQHFSPDLFGEIGQDQGHKLGCELYQIGFPPLI